MMRSENTNRGFTLVELMVVAVIVAILATVAIPLMSGNKKRAMLTEAQVGLGAMRSMLRAQFAETGRYDHGIDGNPIRAPSAAIALTGISAGELNGRFFSDDCYQLTEVGATTYKVEALGDGVHGSPNTAPGKLEVAGITVTLTEAGDFTMGGM